jgi:DNA polymerase-1
VVDYKGLVGDSSDNYPGVPGIGPKTAVELLERYGSLEGIYEGIGGIKDKKVKEKLTAGRESAVLSKRLAQIATEVPLTVDWEKMKLEKEKILPVLAKVGFKSLVERVKRGGNEEGGGDEGGIQGRLF